MTLKGHKERVNDVAFIHGTRLLVTSSADKSLRVWDLDTGKQVGEPLLDHDAEVWRVAASPDGCWIVSGGENGSILIWEVATNKRDLKRVPVSFEGHKGLIRGVVFAPDSETFASASWDETSWDHSKWAAGQTQCRTPRMGKKLAAGTDEHIIIWNTKTGKEMLKIEQRAWRVAFTPDGLNLVSGNRKDIRISDATTGDIIKKFDAHAHPFYSLSIAPNGTKFATTSKWDKMTWFFDLTTFEPIGEPLEHPDGVGGVAFSKDSQLIATGCNDNLVRTWTVPLSESEKESQQSTQKILKKTIPSTQPRPRRAPIPTSRFFDDFDPRSPPERNNRAATATRHAEDSKIKNMMNRLFSRSSAPQGHAPRPHRIPLVDIFATRGKYRTANAHSGKRHKSAQLQRPPRKQAHVGASSSSTPAGVIGGVTSATLQTGSTSAPSTTNRPPSPLDAEHVPDASCFAVLTKYFPHLSRTRQTNTATPRTC
ncbi:WD40 repeat-like protein [Suillus weaverae]|nr:WD40 repeat-like protein [Suillus weaverae]